MNNNVVAARRAFLIVIIVCLVVGLGYAIYNSLVFRLVSTSPSTSNVAVVTPFFKVNFNKQLRSRSVKVSGSTGLVASYSTQGSTLTILFNQPLELTKHYSLVVRDIVASNGQTLPNKTFSFLAKNIATSNLPADQRAALNTQQQQYDEAISGDPLVQLLPFQGGGGEFTVDYKVSYVKQRVVPIIIVTSSTTQGQQDALAWMKQVGVDPTKYQIQYVLQ